MYSRKIVGWAVSASLHTAGLPLLALEHALLSTGASRGRQGLVHRSDRGSQYVSLAYSDALIVAGVSASVGSVGDSYDNALAETVNGLYKAELIHTKRLWIQPRRSSWPRWDGCTGGTRSVSTKPSATAPRGGRGRLHAPPGLSARCVLTSEPNPGRFTVVRHPCRDTAHDEQRPTSAP